MSRRGARYPHSFHPVGQYATTNITRVANPVYKDTGVPHSRCYSDRKSLSRLRKAPALRAALVAIARRYRDHPTRPRGGESSGAGTQGGAGRDQVVDKDDIEIAHHVRIRVEGAFNVYKSFCPPECRLRSGCTYFNERARLEPELPARSKGARYFLRLIESSSQSCASFHRNRNDDIISRGKIRKVRDHCGGEPRRDAFAPRKLEQVYQNKKAIVGDEGGKDARQRVLCGQDYMPRPFLYLTRALIAQKSCRELECAQ